MDHLNFFRVSLLYHGVFRCKEKIALKKTVSTVVKKYKEHGVIGHLQGSGNC